MRKSIIFLTLILFLTILANPISAQVRPPDPTPPNPEPKIPAPMTPKVTPPEPAAPTQSVPISPTASTLPEAEKQPAKSPVGNAAAEQGNSEYIVIAVIALVMLVFGILIGRATKSGAGASR
jgi:preprotein translocase subunit SecG